MLAGRDTTACQLTWLFVRLMTHNDITQRLTDEIATHVGDRLPSHDDFKHMEYLNGCVHETLRLHPSVPGDHKEAVKDDVLPDGKITTRVYQYCLKHGDDDGRVNIWYDNDDA